MKPSKRILEIAQQLARDEIERETGKPTGLLDLTDAAALLRFQTHADQFTLLAVLKYLDEQSDQSQPDGG